MFEARPFRFGYQHLPTDEPGGGLVDAARRAEAAGFDVVHTSDHLLPESLAPLVGLQAAGDATTRLRLCPLVLNNDLHHPLVLAHEIAALDHLTGGRVELGLGAGHAFTEYEAMGLAFDPPAVRKARLAEAVELLRRLLDGETVDHEGESYRLRGARSRRPLQEHVPLLVGVNGRAALAHAARHADVVGLTMVGRTLPDGQRHEVRWEADRLDRTVAHVRASAPAPGPELHALVQAVQVTDDRRGATEALIEQHLPGLSLEDALATPFLCIGTHDEIADHLRRARQRWGISYWSGRDVEALAPVIDRLRAAP